MVIASSAQTEGFTADLGGREPPLILEAVENSATDVPLDLLLKGGKLDVFQEVLNKGFFRIYLNGDSLVFQAGAKVGLIPLNDKIAINVRPRVPIANLERIFMLSGYTPATIPPHQRLYQSHDVNPPSLLDLFANSLICAVDEVERGGKYNHYYQVEKGTSFPSGRILLGATLTKFLSKGQTHKVSISKFERTHDNPLNRCLKLAVKIMADRYRGVSLNRDQRRLVAGLNRVYNYFQDVHLDTSMAFLSAPLIAKPETIPSTRAYYRNAISVALSVIRNEGVALRGVQGDLPIASLVIDMAEVFESYLRAILSEGFKSVAIDVYDGDKQRPLGGGKLLFDSSVPGDLGYRIQAAPDIVLSLKPPIPNGDLLIEVKYKPIIALADREYINQVLAYALSYSSKKAVIVSPVCEGSLSGLHKVGTAGAATLYQYFIDLSSADMQAEENLFVAEIEDLLRTI